jgi:hypothetical protein
LVGCEWICVNANVSIDTDGFIDNDEDRRFSAEALLSDKGYQRAASLQKSSIETFIFMSAKLFLACCVCVFVCVCHARCVCVCVCVCVRARGAQNINTIIVLWG